MTGAASSTGQRPPAPRDHLWPDYVYNEVFRLFTTTPKPKDQPGPEMYEFRKAFRQYVALGGRCKISQFHLADGIGSRGMRAFAAMILAEDVGCDFMWAGFKDADAAGDAAKTAMYVGDMYCHQQTEDTPDENRQGVELRSQAYDPQQGKVIERQGTFVCFNDNWDGFFNFNSMYHVPSPTAEYFHVQVGNQSAIDDAFRNFLAAPASEGEERMLSLTDSALYMLMPPGTPGPARWSSVAVVRRLRSAFRQYPRPGYPAPMTCPNHDPSRINIGVHVRRGDRMDVVGQENLDRQLGYMHHLMASIEAAFGGGENQPVFHAYSETVQKCPTRGAANKRQGDRRPKGWAFEEFPDWPIVEEEAKACRPTLPSDCPEKQLQGFCNPVYPTSFTVDGSKIPYPYTVAGAARRELVLHLNGDPADDVYCMATAEAIVSGCSAFGQLAAVLSRGLKLFHADCTGEMTGIHYRFLPSVAIAEGGDRWVPLHGSWFEPTILSPQVLENEVKKLIKAKQVQAPGRGRGRGRR